MHVRNSSRVLLYSGVRSAVVPWLILAEAVVFMPLFKVKIKFY
jgi:hypothetical protein